jgi:hypothetical protein
MALHLLIHPDLDIVPRLTPEELVTRGRPEIRENEKESSPGFTGTELQAKQIAEMIALGISAEKISKILKISLPLLTLYYEHEIDVTEALVNAKVAKVALDQATSGRDTLATQFWLKSRAGWLEKQRVELTGADGGAIEVAAIRESLVKGIVEHETGETPAPKEDEE